MSDHVLNVLRPHLSEYTSDETALTRAFDAFEFLNAMIYNDLRSEGAGSKGMPVRHEWAPIEAFRWRAFGDFDDFNVVAATRAEIAASGLDWAPLAAGLFGRSRPRAEAALTRVAQFSAKIPLLR